MQATGIKRLTLVGLTALGVAIGSGLAASPTWAQAGDPRIIRQYGDSTHVLQPSISSQTIDRSAVRQYNHYVQLQPSASSSPPLVEADSSGNTGQSSSGVRPAVGDPLGTRFEIIEEVLWVRNNFLGFGSQGKLGALGCSMSTERRKQELNAVAARYEYRDQTGVAETESCTAWFTVRR